MKGIFLLGMLLPVLHIYNIHSNHKPDQHKLTHTADSQWGQNSEVQRYFNVYMRAPDPHWAKCFSIKIGTHR